MIKLKLAILASIVCMTMTIGALAEVPGILNYQGRVTVNGTNYTGTGEFRFALVDNAGTRTFWSNGVGAVSCAVNKGLFAVLLGDTNVSQMAAAVPAAVFTNADVRLRVWFAPAEGDLQQLAPDQRLAAAGYALRADGVAAGGITSEMLAPGAVTTGALAAGSVTAGVLATGSVTADALAVGSVGSTAIADGAVGGSKLADGAVNVDHLAGETLVIHSLAVTNPTPAADDEFGVTIAGVGTDRFVVGVPYDDQGAANAGVVHLYGADGALLRTIANPTAENGDYFGRAVAGVGTSTLVVGAPSDDHGTWDAGVVHLYNADGVRFGMLANPAPVNGDQFGFTVAGVGADTFVVGVPFADRGAVNAGVVHFYRTNGALLLSVTNPTPATDDLFGVEVAGVGPDTFVVGAPNADQGADNAGVVYLYGTNGALLLSVANPSPGTNDRFGANLTALSKDTFLVGVPNTDQGAVDAGVVYLFNTDGALLCTVTNPWPAAGDNFGYAVASVGAGRFVVSEPHDSQYAPDAGVAHLFSASGALLLTVTNPTPAAADQFGSAVAGLGAGRFLVGAKWDDQGAYNAGVVWHYAAGTAVEGLAVTAGNMGDGSVRSNALAVGSVTANALGVGSVTSNALASGAVIATKLATGSVTADALAAGSVGSAAIADGAVGADALAYGAVTGDHLGGETVLMSRLLVPNPTPADGDYFGWAVAGLANGSFVVGARNDDQGAVNAGVVHLFDGAGAFLLTITNPAPLLNDNFGYSVAGVGLDKLVVGAPDDDQGATNAGAAYLYGIDGTLLLTITNPTPAAYDGFGQAVASVGAEAFAVGVPFDDQNGSNRGVVHLYRADGTFLLTIVNPTPNNVDEFGYALAAVGSERFVVGAPMDYQGATFSGVAHLYRADGTYLLTVTNPTPAEYDNFGSAVAGVGDDLFVVGVPSDDQGATNAGVAHLYRTDGSLLLTVTNPTPAVDDNFGCAVAGVGDSMFIVGAYSDNRGATNGGIAYLYRTDGTLLLTITNPTPAANEYFGVAVAGVGAKAFIVGAFRDNEGTAYAGAAWLFSAGTVIEKVAVTAGNLTAGSVTTAALATGSVTSTALAPGSVTASALAAGSVGRAAIAEGAVGSSELAYGAVRVAHLDGPAMLTRGLMVTNPMPVQYEHFGQAVAGVGVDKFLIGEPRKIDQDATNAGAAHLYGADGTLILSFTNPTPAILDYFGYAVAGVGADKLVIGVPYDDQGAHDAGVAHLYRTDGTLLHTVTNPTPAEHDQFGTAVAGVGADAFVVGAPYDDQGNINAGVAHLYRTDGTLLLTVTNPTPGYDEEFGYAVAGVGADTFIVGVPYDDQGAADAGVAHLYRANGAYLLTVTNPTPATDDRFGFAVAGVGPDKFLVGAPNDDQGATNAGVAHLYRTDGTYLLTVTNPTPATDDQFGYSVASVGADKFVVGAQRDVQGATNAGVAHLYHADGTYLLAITNPTPATEDMFGCAMAGVGDKTFVVGAFKDNQGAYNTGVAWLFTLGTTLDGLAVTAGNLNAGAVTSNALAAGSVTSFALAAGSVTSNALAAGSVTAGVLADGAVTGPKIAAGTISNVLLAVGSITGDRLATGTLTGDRLAAGTLTGDRLAPGTVSNALLAANAVGTAQLANGAVTGPKIAAGTISNVLLAVGSITGDRLAAGTLTGDRLAAGTLTGDRLAPGTVSNAQLAANAVGAAQLAAGSVTSNALVAGSVTAGALATGSVTARSLAAGSVGSETIGEGAVGSSKLAYGAVRFDHLAGETLLRDCRMIANASPADGDIFGYAVAGVGADKFVVGAPYDDGGTNNTGAAHLYRADGTFLLGVTNPTPAEFDRFGYSVAGVGTDKFIVGAPDDDQGATNAGVAYLYGMDGTCLLVITNPTPAPDDRFGYALAGVGADRFVVGAPDDNQSTNRAGVVHLYRTDGALLLTVTNPTPAFPDQFGYAVAGVGVGLFAVGAPHDDEGAGMAGVVHLYRTDGTFVLTVTNPVPDLNANFGDTVAAVGTDKFVVGAPNTTRREYRSGEAYLYRIDGTLLLTLTNPTPGYCDLFGTAVAGVGTDKFLVSAPYDDQGAENAGVAYLYRVDGTLILTITNPAPSPYSDQFGHTMAGLDAGTFVVGAPLCQRNYDTGVAWLYSVGVTVEGLAVTAANLEPGSVTTSALAAWAVTGAKLADGAVTGDKIAAGTISNMHLAANSVGTAQLIDGAVTGPKIAAGAISNVLLAANSVGTAQLIDGAVTGPKIAAGAISNVLLAANTLTGDRLVAGTISNVLLAAGTLTGDRLSPGTISNVLLAANAVGTAQLADGAVTGPKIAAGSISNVLLAVGSITGDRLASGTISNSLLATGSLTGDRLAPGTVSNVLLAANAVGTLQLADGAVTGPKIAAGSISNILLATGSLTGDRLVSGTISNSLLATGSLTGDRLAPGTVSNALLAANAVGTAQLADGAVTGPKIAAGTISNVLLAVGSLTSDRLAAGTLTGDRLVPGTISNTLLAANAVGNAQLATGVVTSDKISNGTVSNVDLATGAVNSDTVADGSLKAADVDAATFSNTFWKADGNSGTTAGIHFLGTPDNRPLEFRVANQRALLIVPSNGAPNILLGSISNTIAEGTRGSSVLGGSNNTIAAGADFSAIGGGRQNAIGSNAPYAWAAGRRARALHGGAFVWGDATDADISSTASNQFVIRAAGGVGIGGAPTNAALDIKGDTRINDRDIYLRTGSYHGLGWYGAGKLFAGQAIDGPVTYGNTGGALGISNVTGQAIALSWNTTAVRVPNPIWNGSGTDTTQAPDMPLIMRRLKSTSQAVSNVIARTDTITLERDGTFGGMRFSHSAFPGRIAVSAMGVTVNGSNVCFTASSNNPSAGGSFTLFSNSQNVVYFRCSFGRPYDEGHLTEVSLQRHPGDLFWFGTLTSTYNQ